MKAVGFDQRISIKHLDIAVKEISINPLKEIYKNLDNELSFDIKGEKSRKNAITMIMKIWYFVEPKYESLRNKYLKEYPTLLKKEKLLVHWCMTCLAYPFFKEQVNFLGKQLRMADDVRSRIVLAAMKNLYGDRRRVEVATGAVFSTIKNWNLVNTVSQGNYQLPNEKLEIHSPQLKQLMVEVLMDHLETNSVTIEMINNSAIFFPFDYHIGIGDIAEQKRFTIIKNIRDTIIERDPKTPYLL
ncbi:hypothetical protein U2I53_17150 [Lysinibacillus capsici]|uniref:hypothetical protein n=1 Tax=Lysinibacillus capsici TaxID=2115968 RepID=UPI0032DF44BA